MPILAPTLLTEFATRMLQAGGANADEAACVGRSLVDANLRGYDSHGVMRLPYYIQAVRDGEVVPGAPFTVLSASRSEKGSDPLEAAATLVVDANWGFGQVQMSELLRRLIERARQHGVAVGTMIHSGHIGRLGEYCEAAAAQGLVSQLMVNSHGAAARVAPPGGKSPRLSTNPLAIGVPLGDEPLVLDFSTSATAEGKVRVKKIAGQRCPEGWLLDAEGRPTTDPNALYGNPPGSILPMGGDQSYKGFGLGLMIEILTGALSGGICAREPLYPKKGNCVFCLLLDPSHFGGQTYFAAEVQRLTDYIRSCPRIDGVDRIRLPGDPERETLARRQATGIELDAENWQALLAAAERLNVAPPPGVVRT